MRQASIPQSVIDKVVGHRPHLRQVADNIRLAPAQCEKALADGYLAGETRLTIEETWKLSACCVGRPYGENV